MRIEGGARMALKATSGKQNPRVQVTLGEGLFEETFVIRPNIDSRFVTVQRIDSKGKAHEKHDVSDFCCNCPAGRFDKLCVHADVLRTIGNVPGAYREFQEYMEALGD